MVAVRCSVAKPHKMLRKAPVMLTDSKFSRCSGSSISPAQVPGLRGASVPNVVSLVTGPTNVRCALTISS